MFVQDEITDISQSEGEFIHETNVDPARDLMLNHQNYDEMDIIERKIYTRAADLETLLTHTQVPPPAAQPTPIHVQPTPIHVQATPFQVQAIPIQVQTTPIEAQHILPTHKKTAVAQSLGEVPWAGQLRQEQSPVNEQLRVVHEENNGISYVIQSLLFLNKILTFKKSINTNIHRL